MTPQALYTRVEAAEYLRVSPRTLDRWIKLGLVAVVLPGGPGTYPRITRAELERLAKGE